jgi:hypothetical protein
MRSGSVDQAQRRPRPTRAAMIDPSQPISRPPVCPDCVAEFSGEGTYCWLCGWKLGDPAIVGLKGPPRVNPYVPTPRKPTELKWTFSLSTLFLWTALVAVVMGVVRIASRTGITLGILSLPAALQTTAIAANRKRRSGRAQTVQEKVDAFIESFAWSILIAAGSVFVAFGAFVVTCTASVVGSLPRNGNLVVPISAAVGGAAFVGSAVYLFIRALRRTED